MEKRIEQKTKHEETIKNYLAYINVYNSCTDAQLKMIETIADNIKEVMKDLPRDKNALTAEGEKILTFANCCGNMLPVSLKKYEEFKKDLENEIDKLENEIAKTEKDFKKAELIKIEEVDPIAEIHFIYSDSPLVIRYEFFEYIDDFKTEDYN